VERLCKKKISRGGKSHMKIRPTNRFTQLFTERDKKYNISLANILLVIRFAITIICTLAPGAATRLKIILLQKN
jgi:hypothetical protein